MEEIIACIDEYAIDIAAGMPSHKISSCYGCKISDWTYGDDLFTISCKYKPGYTDDVPKKIQFSKKKSHAWKRVTSGLESFPYFEKIDVNLDVNTTADVREFTIQADPSKFERPPEEFESFQEFVKANASFIEFELEVLLDEYLSLGGDM